MSERSISEEDFVDKFLLEISDVECGFIESVELRKKLSELIALPNSFLGEGGSGRVYNIGSVCIKIMRNRHMDSRKQMFKLGNSVADEFNFQQRVGGLNVQGVIAPRVSSYFESNLGSAIIMERLNAWNMHLIMKGVESLPSDYNNDIFFSALEEFIDAMHCIGVAHGDLYARNIMIDRVTCKPRLIDFGRSKDLSGSNRAELVFADVDRLDETRESMAEYLTHSKKND